MPRGVNDARNVNHLSLEDGAKATGIRVAKYEARTNGISAGDVVEVFNDFGSTYAMAYPQKAIRPGQTFMLFGYIRGVAGDVTSPESIATWCPPTRAPGPTSSGWAAWTTGSAASASRSGASAESGLLRRLPVGIPRSGIDR